MESLQLMVIKQEILMNFKKKCIEDGVEEQESKAEKEIEEIKRIKLSKIGKVWEIRKRLLGGKY